MNSKITRLVLSFAVAATAQTALAQFELDWHTIDGGGGTSSGGAFALSGTIGQPDAGMMSGGSFTLVGGFWGGVGAPSGGLVGDMNCDGFVTVADIGPFVMAISNPAQYAVFFPSCDIMNGDINNDGFITVADIGPFVQLLVGP